MSNGGGNQVAGANQASTSQGQKEALAEEAFITTMVRETCAPPDVRVLAGYVGHSSRGEGWWRLYLTLELNEWVDFYGDDVQYVAPAGSEILSGTVVWLRKDAELWHQSVASQQVRAQDLLQGNLARRYLPPRVPPTVPAVQQVRMVQTASPTEQALLQYEPYDPVTDPPSFGRIC